MTESPAHADDRELRAGARGQRSVDSRRAWSTPTRRSARAFPYTNAAPNLTADIPALVALAAKHEGAAGRQGSEDRPDADQDDHRARPEGAAARRQGLVLDQHPRQPRRRGARRSRVVQDQGGEQEVGARLHPAAEVVPGPLRGSVPRRADQLLSAARRQQGRLGQHRSGRAGSATRCSSRSTSCAATASWRRRSCSTSRCSSISRKRAGMSGVQEWLSFYFKSPVHAPGLYPGARSVHPVDEAEEHAALPEGRGAHHPSGARVLRLTLALVKPITDATGAHRRTRRRCAVGAADRRCRQPVLLPLGRQRRRGGRLPLQQNQPTPITPGDGALVGLLAGRGRRLRLPDRVDSDQPDDGADRAADARASGRDDGQHAAGVPGLCDPKLGGRLRRARSAVFSSSSCSSSARSSRRSAACSGALIFAKKTPPAAAPPSGMPPGA